MITIVPNIYQINKSDLYKLQQTCPVCGHTSTVHWDKREQKTTPQHVCTHFMECVLYTIPAGKSPVFAFSTDEL